MDALANGQTELAQAELENSLAVSEGAKKVLGNVKDLGQKVFDALLNGQAEMDKAEQQNSMARSEGAKQIKETVGQWWNAQNEKQSADTQKEIPETTWMKTAEHEDGEQAEIEYYGKKYTGVYRDGELYLDEKSQSEFLKQIGIITDLASMLRFDYYKDKSVSELVELANLPLDPSKPLPEVPSLLDDALGLEMYAERAIGDANYFYDVVRNDGEGTVTYRFVDQVNESGKVKCTEITVSTICPSEVIEQAKSFFAKFSEIMEPFDALGPGDSAGPFAIMGEVYSLDLLFFILGVASKVTSWIPDKQYASVKDYLYEYTKEKVESKEKKQLIVTQVTTYTVAVDKAGKMDMNTQSGKKTYQMGDK